MISVRMADTDTSPISKLVTTIDLAHAEVTLVPAFQLLLYLAYNKREGELSQFKKLLETVRAEKGAARVDWSPNDEVFREALIRFEADNHAILESEKTQVERVIPREAAVSAQNEFLTIHQKKLQQYRRFAKNLTDTYVDQLKKQARNEDQKRVLEEYRSSLTKRVEGVLPNLVADARSPNELVPRLSQYLAGVPAFEASLQGLSQDAGPAAQAAANEVATQTGELFLDPTEAVEQSVYAPVLDKTTFVRIFQALSSENATYSAQRITREATKLTLLNQVVNGIIEPELDTARSDVFLTAFARTGLQRFVAPIAAALPDKTKAVLSEIIVRRSWEKAVDELTKKAGGRMAIELTPLIQQGNKTMGSGPQRGVSSLQNVIGDTASFIFGSPTEEMVSFLKLAQLNTTGAGQDKGQSQAQALEALAHIFQKSQAGAVSQVATTESRFLLLTSLLFVHAPERFRVYYQHGTETAGRGLRFVFDLGSDFLFGKILKSGAVQAGATVVKKGAASFFAGLLTKLGLSATADVILAIVGTPIATAIKWAVQAVIWLGGYLWRPLVSLVGGFFRGEIGPWGSATNAIKESMQNMLGGAGAAQSRARWDDDLPKLLAWGAVIAVLLFMLPLSPFSNFIDMVRSAALITSLQKQLAGSAGTSCDPNSDPRCSLSPCDPSRQECRWPTSGCIIQGPFNTAYTHEHLNAVDFSTNGVNGVTVIATVNGVVTEVHNPYVDNTGYVGNNDGGGYGNYIVIRSDDGRYILKYGHLSRDSVTVTEGQHVSVGSPIAAVDQTGNSDRPHLHFENRTNESINTLLPVAIPACWGKYDCAQKTGGGYELCVKN